MDSENKKTKQPLWLYALVGLLAIGLIIALVNRSSLKSEKEALESRKGDATSRFSG